MEKWFGYLLASELQMSIDDMALPKLAKDEKEQYYRLSRLRDLYRKAADHGIRFTFEDAKSRGWLCRHDLKVFQADFKNG